MIEILQWSTLIVCGAVAIARIPSALRKENRSLFCIFTLATFAILLSIDGPYTAIDSVLDSQNYTNLILRFLVYGTIFLAGVRVGKGFSAGVGIRLLMGPVGLTVLAIITAATVVLFLLADTAGTSTGLANLSAKGPSNDRLIGLYAAAGRLYPSFVAACLVPATARALTGRLPAMIRLGAGLLTVAFVALVLGSFFPLIPQGIGYLQFIINYTAVLALIIGLTVIWLARVRAAQRARQKSYTGN
ncbi:hypothetical protein [Pseudarthrobacter sp. N5]|uniref:hypothetical protein n=1 Tax=Pseudarthrobacter sp. N5 TaxID=3418416 RepID=UPI003CF35884